MSNGKETVFRLYASGSADFVDADGNVRSVADFDNRTMKMADERFPAALMPEVVAAAALRRSAQSRRGGRVYNEGSDSEHDPFWNIPVGRISPNSEQAEINRQGAQAVRDELHRVRYTPE